METPWGPSQNITVLAEGIIFVDTSSHGGVHLDAKRNAKMPGYMRASNGFYEEDCGWARPAVVFPEAFPKDQEDARKTLADWAPELYEKFFNCSLKPGESRTKDQHEFLKAHANDYIVTTAWGSWHKQVPPGMVGVCAYIGADRTKHCAYFLVAEDEYHKRSRDGFVIDPVRHQASHPIESEDYMLNPH